MTMTVFLLSTNARLVMKMYNRPESEVRKEIIDDLTRYINFAEQTGVQYYFLFGLKTAREIVDGTRPVTRLSFDKHEDTPLFDVD